MVPSYGTFQLAARLIGTKVNDPMFDFVLFAAIRLAKGLYQRSQGQRPWKLERNKSICPTAIFNLP